jgi:serine/threonine protein kinase
MTNEDMSEKLQVKRFGRYLLIDHLVDGGMATIFRARYLGEQGNKIVAIKVIQPQYSKDESFKKMFLDEIKVTFGLIHPNIAQTYDYGIEDDQLFTAMEYIDGKNLKQYMDKLKEKRFIFPVEISVFIAAQVCQGLNYAHTFSDKLSGKNVNIIHRDISPHNIMLTYDGAVKIIDFGIAKAETNSEETKAGTIKGKLSYLAPEYLEGSDLDHRYDQFAVGITLWELLCGRKLFSATNELATLKLIQECKVPPPSSINPKVHPELEAIVLKALSKDRQSRFKDMDQFNRALVKFLYSHYPDFNATDLSYFASELFKEIIKADRDKLVIYGKIDISPFLNQLNENQQNQHNQNQKANEIKKQVAQEIEKEATKKNVNPNPRVMLDLGENIVKGQDKISLELPKSALRGQQNQGISIPKNLEKTDTLQRKNPLIVQKKNDTPNMNKSLENHPDHINQRKQVHQTHHELQNDIKNQNEIDESKKINQIILNFLINNPYAQKVGVVLVVGLIGLFFYNKTFNSTKNLMTENQNKKNIDRVPSSDSLKSNQPEVVNSNETTGFKKYIIKNSTLEQRFFINDEEIVYDLTGVELPLDKEIRLRVESSGKRPVFLYFTTSIDSDGIIEIPESVDASFGMLKSYGEYSDGTKLFFRIDGNDVNYKLPIKEEVKLPIGNYQGVIKNNRTDLEKVVEFEIKENVITRLPR